MSSYPDRIRVIASSTYEDQDKKWLVDKNNTLANIAWLYMKRLDRTELPIVVTVPYKHPRTTLEEAYRDCKDDDGILYVRIVFNEERSFVALVYEEYRLLVITTLVCYLFAFDALDGLVKSNLQL